MNIRFELRVGSAVHRPAPPELMEAFQQAQITEAVGQYSGFQLSFWAGKGSIVTEAMIARLFDPPMRVIMSVVLQGRRHVLFDGAVTRHDYVPSNSAGESTLNLSGRDLTFYMDLVDATGRCFPAAPPSTQVGLVLAPYVSFGVVPAPVPDVVQLFLNPVEKISAQRGTDFAYLTSLADQSGFTFYVDPGPQAGTSIAYWGPEVRVGIPQPALSIASDAGSNVESLSFSFDGTAPKVVTADFFDETNKRTIPIPLPDVGLLKPPLGPEPPRPLKHVKETLDIPEPASGVRSTGGQGPRITTAEQDRRAADLMKKHNTSFFEKLAYRLAYANVGSDPITASGQLDVLRYGNVLRSRKLVGVRGASARYDGPYYVTSVQHTIKPGSYTQSFGLARGQFRSFTPRVEV